MPLPPHAGAHLLLCLPLCLSHMPSLLPLPPSPHLPFADPLRFSPSCSPPPPSRLTPSPAHHILLQPINNFWAIAPGPHWARPLRRRSTAQPLSAPAASSKVQWGFHSPSPRQGVEEAAGKERRRCQGSLAQEKGVTFTSAGTAGDGQAPAAPRAGDAERATKGWKPGRGRGGIIGHLRPRSWCDARQRNPAAKSPPCGMVIREVSRAPLP